MQSCRRYTHATWRACQSVAAIRHADLVRRRRHRQRSRRQPLCGRRRHVDRHHARPGARLLRVEPERDQLRWNRLRRRLGGRHPGRVLGAEAAVGIGIAGPTKTFQLLDASKSVLEGYSVTTTPTNTYYYINRLTNDTKYLRVAGNFVAIDDLQFDVKTVSSVPEPEAYALMLAGLGALGFMARRRRR